MRFEALPDEFRFEVGETFVLAAAKVPDKSTMKSGVFPIKVDPPCRRVGTQAITPALHLIL
jgi:hypothetical protein